MSNTENLSEEARRTPPEEGVPAEQIPYEQLLLTLQDAQAKADEHWNQLLRTRAEMENLRRRAERDVENAHKYALEKFVDALLPVRDSLEMGLATVGDEVADIARIREGIDMSVKMLQSAMEKMGVKEIDPQGEKFNPELHQAMVAQETVDAEPNTVLAVYQKGYLLNGRVVRPARVVVSKPKS